MRTELADPLGLYIGVMSGTSLDGIDLVAVKFTGQTPHVLAKRMMAFPEKMKDLLIALSQGEKITLQEVGQIDHLLGQTYADCINHFIEESQLNRNEIQAIGCHGQTVFHQPDGEYPFTMQLGDANIIAAKTGIVTVADFRRKDMALGGQGAPLVPAFHAAMFSDPSLCRVIVNIGGIANITVLQPNETVQGYDTGPGNMLMDAWIHKHKGLAFDPDGQWASEGHVDALFLNQLLSAPYFSKPQPKSTGRELFHLTWLEEQIALFGQSLKSEDIQASLLMFTACSIANEIKMRPAGELLVCGGGAKNPQLMKALQEELSSWKVIDTDNMMDSDYVEAIAFAWLASRILSGKTGNLPAVTGASRQCLLGAIYLPD